ncbi:MAG: putative SOS response-associated peptidase YedK [Pseudomonas sp.]|nr:MAG: putative SOS response-associated peptidase YedK [Pseudomonas sp.]
MIITADAQGGLVDVHDRRPVVLSPDLAVEWIAAGMPSEHAEQIVLNLSEPAEAFEWYRVSIAVGNVQNQVARLIEPISVTLLLIALQQLSYLPFNSLLRKSRLHRFANCIIVIFCTTLKPRQLIGQYRFCCGDFVHIANHPRVGNIP